MPPFPPVTPPAPAAPHRPWAGLAAVLAAAAAWAAAAHLASMGKGPPAWGVLLALGPVIAAAALALWSLPSRALAAVGGAGAVALLVLAWPWLIGRVPLLFFVEQTGINLLLATAFGRTLFGPGESLVTQMARQHEGGQLSPRKQVYTRRVTVAWTLFFTAIAGVSVSLFLWAPLSTWSAFANLMGGPLIAAMFAAELLCRRIALAGETPVSLADTLQAWHAHSVRRRAGKGAPPPPDHPRANTP